MKGRILYFLIRFWLRGRFSTRARLERYQQRKLNTFIKKCLPQSPYYKKLLEKNTPFADFPVMNKALFMEHFDTINTVGICKEKAMQIALQAEEDRNFKTQLNGISVGLSTGTSGKRGLFLVSRSETARWVALVISRVVKPRLFNKQKVAFFLRANNNLYEAVKSALFEFRYFDLFVPNTTLLNHLDVFRPHVLAGPPSMLVTIAEAMAAGQLHIAPQQVISFAEVLDQADKAYLTAVFGIGITEVYQCTEGFLGVTCAHGTLHLNEDFMIIEKKYVDDCRFHPVITDFTRTSQPILKYELDDLLHERTEPCPCGSVFIGLEKIEGRQNDILLFNNDNLTVKIYPDLISRVIARATDGFRTYRVLQTGPEALHIEIDCKDEDYPRVSAEMEKAIASLCTQQGAGPVKITTQKGISLAKGDKLRKITRLNYEDQHSRH